ncbi:hypothetical protein EVAR_29032_1 [Eumeta japonica]|uniref:Uncharacterized protein n=1 Tax=Eumeta variegata TaxID=151549 RepID=A0A4C1W533_EUMVA|nr:hypothetical protein EVAR_29032_1 [Eumeta japonica]
MCQQRAPDARTHFAEFIVTPGCHLLRARIGTALPFLRYDIAFSTDTSGARAGAAWTGRSDAGEHVSRYYLLFILNSSCVFSTSSTTRRHRGRRRVCARSPVAPSKTRDNVPIPVILLTIFETAVPAVPRRRVNPIPTYRRRAAQMMYQRERRRTMGAWPTLLHMRTRHFCIEFIERFFSPNTSRILLLYNNRLDVCSAGREAVDERVADVRA